MFDVEKIVRLLLVTSVTTTTKVEAQYCLYEEKCIDRKDMHMSDNRQRALEGEICLLVTSTVPKSVLDRLGISVLEILTAISKSELLRNHLKLAIKATLDLPSGTLFADIGTTIKAIKDKVVSSDEYE